MTFLRDPKGTPCYFCQQIGITYDRQINGRICRFVKLAGFSGVDLAQFSRRLDHVPVIAAPVATAILLPAADDITRIGLYLAFAAPFVS
jgi:hypothetical protein